MATLRKHLRQRGVSRPHHTQSKKMEEKAYLYEMKSACNTHTGDVLLTEDEEKIMRAMRRLDMLWRKYKDKGGDNNLILFAGGSGCSIRYGTPSGDNEIENFPFVRCEGGEGGDAF